MCINRVDPWPMSYSKGWLVESSVIIVLSHTIYYCITMACFAFRGIHRNWELFQYLFLMLTTFKWWVQYEKYSHTLNWGAAHSSGLHSFVQSVDAGIICPIKEMVEQLDEWMVNQGIVKCGIEKAPTRCQWAEQIVGTYDAITQEMTPWNSWRMKGHE